MPTDAADASLWTQEEAKAFFEAFQKYNTDWEQVNCLSKILKQAGFVLLAPVPVSCTCLGVYTEKNTFSGRPSRAQKGSWCL